MEKDKKTLPPATVSINGSRGPVPASKPENPEVSLSSPEKKSATTSLPSSGPFITPFSKAPPSEMLDIQFPMRSGAQVASTPNNRNKVALEPGHSPLDWQQVTSSSSSSNSGQGKVSLEQLALHDKEEDIWISIHGIVYDATRYLPFHPGGRKMLMKGAGKDATRLFESVHPWVNPHRMLEKYKVGSLSL